MNRSSRLLLTSLATIAAIGMPAAKSESIAEFDFGVNDRSGLPKDPRVIKQRPSPCGIYVTARVGNMPRLGDRRSYLVPDRVVEIDRQNRTLRRWAVPLEAQIMGISGDRLLVQASDKIYWFYTSGTFQLQPKQPTRRSATNLPRIKSHPEFPGSGYLQTIGYRDLQTGRLRRFLYEAPCT